jgi:hypothetical protein
VSRPSEAEICQINIHARQKARNKCCGFVAPLGQPDTIIATGDDTFAKMPIAPLAQSAKSQLRRLRDKLETEQPHSRCSDVERQARLAQSGRFPDVNYLVV